MHTNKRTINDEIQTIVDNSINQILYPDKCTITKVYEDGYCDIKSETYGKIRYTETIGTPTLNNTGVLIFLNNNINQRIILCDNKGGTK